jgi:hypothetical protein
LDFSDTKRTELLATVDFYLRLSALFFAHFKIKTDRAQQWWLISVLLGRPKTFTLGQLRKAIPGTVPLEKYNELPKLVSDLHTLGYMERPTDSGTTVGEERIILSASFYLAATKFLQEFLRQFSSDPTPPLDAAEAISALNEIMKLQKKTTAHVWDDFLENLTERFKELSAQDDGVQPGNTGSEAKPSAGRKTKPNKTSRKAQPGTTIKKQPKEPIELVQRIGKWEAEIYWVVLLILWKRFLQRNSWINSDDLYALIHGEEDGFKTYVRHTRMMNCLNSLSECKIIETDKRGQWPAPGFVDTRLN